MPYLHLDLPGTYPLEGTRELATRLCKLYADLMERRSCGDLARCPKTPFIRHLRPVPARLVSSLVE
jgi:hypothetical protein